MASARARLVLATGWLCVLSGCATPQYIGNWAYQGERAYVGVALDKNGSCRYVFAAKVDHGNGQSGSTGGGHFCTYAAQGEKLVISEVWERGGARQRLPDPIVMELSPNRTSLFLRFMDAETFTLHRVSQILN